MEFIHLTDLHYSDNSPFQLALIEALLSDLREQMAKGLQPDFLVFSGDLVNNPDDEQIYDRFVKEFLEPVIGVLNIPIDHVIACPGNHDLSFVEMKKREMVYNNLHAPSMNQDYIVKLASKHELLEYSRGISLGFFGNMAGLGTKWERSPFFDVASFLDKKVSFVAINTAFGCFLEGSASDRGKLVFPVALALKAFQSIPADHRIISVGHHPLTDTTEETCRQLSALIERRSIVHCYGHIHQAKPSANHSSIGKCFLVQGGALYEHKGCFNGYSIIRIAEGVDHVSATYRTYWVDRQEFDDGTNVTKGGVFYSSDTARQSFERAVKPATDKDVCAWLQGHLSQLIEKFGSTMTGRQLLDTFVEPLIVEARQAKSDSSAVQQGFDFGRLLKDSDHFVIAADNEFGSTSLIRYLALQAYINCASLPKPVVPVVLDARKLRAYPNAILGAIRGEIPDSDDPSLKPIPLHDAGRLLIIVEDFDVSSVTQVDSMKLLIKEWPRAKLVVVAKMPFIVPDRLRPVLGIDDFKFLQLRPMNRGRVRALVEKWKLPNELDTDTVVEEISARFRALGIPLTGAYISIYLSIIQEVKGFNPINSSNVIEQFVEVVLEKYKPEYNFRGSFDYKNQVDYLAAMTEKMCYNNTFIVDYEDFYKWTKQYFDEIGIDQDYQKLIEYFINNKILFVDGNTVCFRYNLFLSFFVSHRMMRSSEFKNWVLTDNRHINYINEIDIYCGLSRSDGDILEALSAKYKIYADQLSDLVAPLAWDHALESLQLPRGKDEREFVDSIVRQLVAPASTPASERDNELSAGETPVNAKPVSARPEIQGVLPNWFLTLRAYSVALKNLENLSKEQKEKHLRQVIGGWATVLQYACLLFRDLIEKPEIKLGTMSFRLVLPEKSTAELLRRIFLQIPTTISHMVRQDIGSQKLELLLRAEYSDMNLAENFLQSGVYADLKLKEYLLKLNRLHKKIDGKTFLLEALLVKMRDIYMRFGVSDTDREPFRHLVAEIYADVLGFKGSDRHGKITGYLTELDKQERVARIRENVS